MRKMQKKLKLKNRENFLKTIKIYVFQTDELKLIYLIFFVATYDD